MSEYIIREEVFQKLHDVGGCGATDEWSKGYDEAIGVAIGIIEDTPSADVAPVVHGHWTDYYFHPCGNRGKCSVCGKYNIPTNYCPECGAKMDESEGEK